MTKIQRYTSDGCPYEYGGWVEWEDVEALVKDAERYRWLRENAIDSHMWNDESIDAAMTKDGA